MEWICKGGFFNTCFTTFVAINVLKTFAVRPGTFFESIFLKKVLTFIELMLSKIGSEFDLFFIKISNYDIKFLFLWN